MRNIIDRMRRAVASATGRGERMPVYVQGPDASISRDGERLKVQRPGSAPDHVRLADMSELVLVGPVAVTAPCLAGLMRSGIAVTWCSMAGWPIGRTELWRPADLSVRCAQYRIGETQTFAVDVARILVTAKIANTRTLLRRRPVRNVPQDILDELARAERSVGRAETLAEIRGVEGSAAAAWFRLFPSLFTGHVGCALADMFPGRRRHPSPDPLNALLSFGYGVLARRCEQALWATGLDPAYGFLHQPRAGRPALALDLMEPWRSVIVDSTILRMVNHGEVRRDAFTVDDEDGMVMSPDLRRSVLAGLEARLREAAEGAAHQDWIARSAKALAGAVVCGSAADLAPWRWR